MPSEARQEPPCSSRHSRQRQARGERASPGTRRRRPSTRGRPARHTGRPWSWCRMQGSNARPRSAGGTSAGPDRCRVEARRSNQEIRLEIVVRIRAPARLSVVVELAGQLPTQPVVKRSRARSRADFLWATWERALPRSARCGRPPPGCRAPSAARTRPASSAALVRLRRPASLGGLSGGVEARSFQLVPEATSSACLAGCGRHRQPWPG